MTAVSQLLYVWVLVCSALSIAPMFPLLGAQFHLGQQALSLLTGVNVLTLGFANILIVPLSNIFGRRPISIIAGFFVILTNIWQALATSHQSLLAARACNGIVAATSETIMVQVIADMFFLHERGFWVSRDTLADSLVQLLTLLSRWALTSRSTSLARFSDQSCLVTSLRVTAGAASSGL